MDAHISDSAPKANALIALVGNPNTGKSSLFNALCGMNARVGNFPGVTVEKKLGKYVDAQGPVTVVDLPGTYSLSARSADEMVSVDVLLGQSPELEQLDAIVAVLDATNIERNLYLLSQVRELGLPVVGVLNMWDRVPHAGVTIDVEALSKRLNIPLVTTSAHKRNGIESLQRTIRGAIANPQPPPPSIFPDFFVKEIDSLKSWMETRGVSLKSYVLERLLLDIDGRIETLYTSNPKLNGLLAQIKEARERLASQNCRVPAAETRLRYAWVRSTVEDVVKRSSEHRVTPSDRIDGILTHRWWGLAFFIVAMFLVFQFVFADTGVFSITALIGFVTEWLAEWVTSILGPGALRSLINDGIIGGVGGVLTFVPQIVALFTLIAILEDCGYMARVALVMDKLMTSLGLSGKAFLPLMTSFGCAVPGMMATRTMENRRDRMVTLLVAPLMSCSARLPVYTLMITAFVPTQAYLNGWITLHGLLFLAMYSLGAIVAIPIAWLLKKFVFPGNTAPFVLELPEYKWPSVRVVFQRVLEQVYSFVTRAGTLILCTSILVWAAAYFPGDHTNEMELTQKLEVEEQLYQTKFKERDKEIQKAKKTNPELAKDLEATPIELNPQIEEWTIQVNHERSRLIESSYLGRFGKSLEPVFHAVGWDWKIGVGVIAAFPAREVIIATLGTIYSLGSDIDESSDSLKEQLQASTWPDGRPVFNLVTALSIMVFFALCAQCAATLMTIYRETQSWWWPVFTFLYMTGLAYFGAWLVYTIGTPLLQ